MDLDGFGVVGRSLLSSARVVWTSRRSRCILLPPFSTSDRFPGQKPQLRTFERRPPFGTRFLFPDFFLVSPRTFKVLDKEFFPLAVVCT